MIIEIGENPHNKKYVPVIKYPPYRRSRAGDYRICFKIIDNYIYIATIDKRSTVYN